MKLLRRAAIRMAAGAGAEDVRLTSEIQREPPAAAGKAPALSPPLIRSEMHGRTPVADLRRILSITR